MTFLNKHVTSLENNVTSLNKHVTSLENNVTSLDKHVTSLFRLVTSLDKHVTSIYKHAILSCCRYVQTNSIFIIKYIMLFYLDIACEQ